MVERHLGPADLAGKTIDAHTHLGVSLKAYAHMEYPYAQSIEGLYYRQRASGVGVSVVFPFTPDLHFRMPDALHGDLRPATDPVSPAPYALENRLVMMEVFTFCPEWRDRFLPFVSMDPGRAIDAQIEALDRLADEFPLYGIKINPVLCQSPVTDLLGAGRPLVRWACERNLGILLHVNADPEEDYSQVRPTFEVTQQFPEVRFCLAHCAAFDKQVLEAAARAPNVWVDTAALKIQVQCARENHPAMAARADRFDTDYSDHRRVLRDLARAYPDTIVWGSDSPAYSYMCRRKQAEGHYLDFQLKANYEDEVAALDALEPQARRRVGSTNTLRFIFGPDAI